MFKNVISYTRAHLAFNEDKLRIANETFETLRETINSFVEDINHVKALVSAGNKKCQYITNIKKIK